MFSHPSLPKLITFAYFLYFLSSLEKLFFLSSLYRMIADLNSSSWGCVQGVSGENTVDYSNGVITEVNSTHGDPIIDTDALSSSQSLLQLAREAGLLTRARDFRSGNISLLPGRERRRGESQISMFESKASSLASKSSRTCVAVIVSPRQVDKAKLQVKDMCFCVVQTSQRVVQCVASVHSNSSPTASSYRSFSSPASVATPPPSASFINSAQPAETLKSSIDTGMQGILYEALPQVCEMLHFHYQANMIVLPDAVTMFAYPCGVEEEARAVIACLQEKNLFRPATTPQSNPPYLLASHLAREGCLVELVHHGYLLMLTKSNDAQKVLECWRVIQEKARKEQSVDEMSECDVGNILCPVFVGASIVGAVETSSATTCLHLASTFSPSLATLQSLACRFSGIVSRRLESTGQGDQVNVEWSVRVQYRDSVQDGEEGHALLDTVTGMVREELAQQPSSQKAISPSTEFVNSAIDENKNCVCEYCAHRNY